MTSNQGRANDSDHTAHQEECTSHGSHAHMHARAARVTANRNKEKEKKEKKTRRPLSILPQFSSFRKQGCSDVVFRAVGRIGQRRRYAYCT